MTGITEIFDFYTLGGCRFKQGAGICLKFRIVLHEELACVRGCILMVFLLFFIGGSRHHRNRRFLNFITISMEAGCWNLLTVYDCPP